MMKRFQDLLVWQKAHVLALGIYRVTKRFPNEERHGLVSQMRRAAVSVPANLVEGHKRTSKRDFANFLSIAESSLEELKYYLLLSRDLGYLTTDVSNSLYDTAEEIGRMLHGLKAYVRKEISNAKTAS